MNEYRLEQLFDLQMGKTPSRNESTYWLNGLHDWISIRDLSNSSKYIKETNEKLSDIAVKESGIRIIPKDTVIMSFKLSIGKVAITSHDMYSNEAIMAFHDKKVIEILPEYLYYLLLAKNWDEGSNKAVMGITLNKATLSMIKIRIHDIVNQAQITGILDNLDKQIYNKKKQLTEYDYLIKSRFVEMFESFEKTDLSNIAEIIMGQSPDSAYYNENGVGLPFFQGKADFGAKYTNVSYWTTKPSKTAKKGNVLMSVRAPVGPVNISSVDCCIGRGLCSINAIPNKTNNEFLYNALIAIQDQITAMGTGCTFKAINKSDVYAIQLPLAPISLQNEFAIFVDQVDKLKFTVQKSLEETQTLFNSLMQTYFG